MKVVQPLKRWGRWGLSTSVTRGGSTGPRNANPHTVHTVSHGSAAVAGSDALTAVMAGPFVMVVLFIPLV